MSDPVVGLVCDAQAAIGESPVWRDGTLWWTDPVNCRLLQWSDAGFDATLADAPVWSLAMLTTGDFVGSRDDRFCVVSPQGVSDGPVAALDPGCRFNDMAVDRQGGLWVGAMHRGVLATRGSIYHARSMDAVPRRVAHGLGVPNGMKVSTDGETLYVVDTLERTLLAYPITSEGLGEPRIVCDFLGRPGKPDGMVLAPDGGFWVAMWGGGAVVRIAPDGAFLQSVAIPAPHVSSLCFAGADRLFVTTSRMRLGPPALAEWPGSGGVFEIRLKDAA